MSTNMTGFRYLCVLVLWAKVASALEGLIGNEPLNTITFINQGVYAWRFHCFQNIAKYNDNLIESNIFLYYQSKCLIMYIFNIDVW